MSKPTFTLPTDPEVERAWGIYVAGASWTEGEYPDRADVGYYEQTAHGQGMLSNFYDHWVALAPEEPELFPADAPEPEASASEPESPVNIPTRIDVINAEPGKTAPLMLDLGTDACIVLQPKPDQGNHELALNIVVGAGLPIEIVAWMLGQAAETLVNGIRNSPFIKPV